MSERGSRHESLVAALKQVRAAQNEVERILKRDYPPGAAIRWTRGERVYDGRVDRNCYGDRLFVTNIATGKTFDIYAYRIAS